MNVVFPKQNIRRFIPAVLLLTITALPVFAQQTVDEILAAEAFLRPLRGFMIMVLMNLNLRKLYLIHLPEKWPGLNLQGAR